MSWKNWPYWVKGGIVGILINLILIIIGTGIFRDPYPILSISFFLFILLYFILVFSLSGYIIKKDWASTIKGAVIGLISYVLLLAILSFFEFVYSGFFKSPSDMSGLATYFVFIFGWIVIPLFAIISLIYGKIKNRKVER